MLTNKTVYYILIIVAAVKRLVITEATMRGCSSMVEHQPSKLDTWVRFPSPALLKQLFRVVVKRYESVAQLDRATAF